jgi:hypothetical protein
MKIEISKTVDTVAAAVEKKITSMEQMLAGGVFTVTCHDKDGNLKWEERNHNLVVNQGLKDMNDKYFSGSTYTAAWYIGLVQGPASGTTFAAGDTLASHAGWTEDTAYAGNRKTATFGAATTADPSVINNSASPAQFTMNGTTTIGGAFLTNVATGTSGILFSASDFQSPGDRSVVNGDVLNVTYTFNLDAA